MLNHISFILNEISVLIFLDEILKFGQSGRCGRKLWLTSFDCRQSVKMAEATKSCDFCPFLKNRIITENSMVVLLRNPQLHPFNINNQENLQWFYYFHLGCHLFDIRIRLLEYHSNFWKASWKQNWRQILIYSNKRKLVTWHF